MARWQKELGRQIEQALHAARVSKIGLVRRIAESRRARGIKTKFARQTLDRLLNGDGVNTALIDEVLSVLGVELRVEVGARDASTDAMGHDLSLAQPVSRGRGSADMTDRQLQIPPHITEDAEAMPFERILLAARLIRQLEPEDRRWVVRALATALVDIEPDAMREIVTKLLHPAPDTGAALDAPKEAQRRRETTGH